MKKTNKRITAIAAAAATIFSMTVAMNFTATAAEKISLKKQSEKFLINNDVFAKKYADAETRLENNSYLFDYVNETVKYNKDGKVVDISERKVDYADYQVIRDEINNLYKAGNFDYKSFVYHGSDFQLEDIEYSFDGKTSIFAGYSLRDNGKYEFARYDVDGDDFLSIYDYCCFLKYIQDKYKMIVTYELDQYGNEIGTLYKGEISAKIRNFETDEHTITAPTEVYYEGHIVPIMDIEKNAFSKCKNAEAITIKNYAMPAWFKKIEKYDDELFDGKYQYLDSESERTPSSIFINIDDNAFYGCENLNIINFPTNVNFSSSAFSGTPFFSSGENYSTDENSGIIYVTSSDKKSVVACGIDADKFKLVDQDGKMNFDIADNTTTVTGNLKQALYSVDENIDYSVTIPESVKYIHENAFALTYVNNIPIIYCPNLKWINGKTFNELNENDPKEKELKEFIARNNAAFQSTKYIIDAAQKVIDDQINEIKSTYSDKTDQFNAVCRYIFKKADYRNFDYMDGEYLFANGDYNTIDESRDNVYSAANLFLSDYTECESYAMALSLMLDQLDIKNYVIGGSGHALNAVYLNNKWYRVDMSGYSDYNRNYDFYLRKCEEEGKDPSFLHTDGIAGFGISGKIKLSGFEHTKQITYDTGLDIVDFGENNSSLVILKPDNKKVPDSVSADIRSGKIEFYKNGFYRRDDDFYYYDENGNKIKNIDDKKIGDTYYSFDSNGKIKHGIGWFVIDGKYYYAKLDKNGKETLNKYCWDYIDGNWYYFDESGAYKTGWCKYGDDYYFCDINEGMIVDKFIKVDNRYYHLDSTGKKEVNTNVSWNGNTLTADSKGELDLSELPNDEWVRFDNEASKYNY